jgi:peptidoglycan/LPS O-acetylase OafA/YrhL
LTENVCIAALIAASMLHPKSILARPLTSRILTTLGVVSYSVYVWQELFMVLMPRQGVVSIVGWIATMALISLASYEYIERPFVRLGHRLTVRARTSGNATLSKIEVTP